MATSKKTPKSTASTYLSNPLLVILNGFDRLFAYNQPFAIVLLVLGVLSYSSRYAWGSDRSSPASSPADSGSLAANQIAAIVVLVLLTLFIAFVLATLVNGITAYFGWKTYKKERGSFKEGFRLIFDRFWTIAFIEVLVFAKVLGGLLLLVVPGIRALLRYQFALYPIFDEDLTATAAISRSKELTKGHLTEIGGMVIIASIIPIAGLTLQIGGESVMYGQIKKLKASKASKPPVHWLNYLLLYGIVGLALVLFATVSVIYVVHRYVL